MEQPVVSDADGQARRRPGLKRKADDSAGDGKESERALIKRQRFEIFGEGNGRQPLDKTLLLLNILNWTCKIHHVKLFEPHTGKADFYPYPVSMTPYAVFSNCRHTMAPRVGYRSHLFEPGKEKEDEQRLKVIGTESQAYFLALIKAVACINLVDNSANCLECLHCHRKANETYLYTLARERAPACCHPSNFNRAGEMVTVWAEELDPVVENNFVDLFSSVPHPGSKVRGARVGSAVCPDCLYEHYISCDRELLGDIEYWHAMEAAYRNNVYADTPDLHRRFCSCNVPERVGSICLFRLSAAIMRSDEELDSHSIPKQKLFQYFSGEKMASVALFHDTCEKDGVHHDFVSHHDDETIAYHFNVLDRTNFFTGEEHSRLLSSLLAEQASNGVHIPHPDQDVPNAPQQQQQQAHPPAFPPNPAPAIAAAILPNPPTDEEIDQMNLEQAVGFMQGALPWVDRFYSCAQRVVAKNGGRFNIPIEHRTTESVPAFCTGCGEYGHNPTKLCPFSSSSKAKPRKGLTRGEHFGENVKGFLDDMPESTRHYLVNARNVCHGIVGGMQNASASLAANAPLPRPGPTPEVAHSSAFKGRKSRLTASIPFPTLHSVRQQEYDVMLELETFFDVKFYKTAIPIWRDAGYDVSDLESLEYWLTQALAQLQHNAAFAPHLGSVTSIVASGQIKTALIGSLYAFVHQNDAR